MNSLTSQLAPKWAEPKIGAFSSVYLGTYLVSAPVVSNGRQIGLVSIIADASELRSALMESILDALVAGALAGAFFIHRSYLLRDFFDVFGDSRLKQPQGSQVTDDRATYESLRQRVRERGLDDLSPDERELFRRLSP